MSALLLSLLHLAWPLVAVPGAAALSALVIKWFHSAATIGKLKATTATDQAAFDDLEHLLDTAVSAAISKVAGDIGSKSPGEIAEDALAILKTLATEQTLADLVVVAKVTGAALWPYLLARLQGKAADAVAQTKVLSVPADDTAAFDKLSLAQKRAAIAALGTPTAKLEIAHTVKSPGV